MLDEARGGGRSDRRAPGSACRRGCGMRGPASVIFRVREEEGCRRRASSPVSCVGVVSRAGAPAHAGSGCGGSREIRMHSLLAVIEWATPTQQRHAGRRTATGHDSKRVARPPNTTESRQCSRMRIRMLTFHSDDRLVSRPQQPSRAKSN